MNLGALNWSHVTIMREIHQQRLCISHGKHCMGHYVCSLDTFVTLRYEDVSYQDNAAQLEKMKVSILADDEQVTYEVLAEFAIL